MLGQQVAKGEVLAWLRPVASSQERGDQQALLADLDAQTAIAERRVRRLDQLEGALPQKDIEAARLELVALQQRRAAIGARLAGAEPLRAPGSGVISTAHAVAGQVVDAREVVFEVINPSRLMVEAQSFETTPTGHLSQASAQFAGGSVPLRYLGAAPQLNQQAMTLLFRVEGSNSALANHPLSVGQPVSVIATTAQRSNGVAVPLAALVKNAAGENVVWLHTGAERFEARSVKWSVLDGERVAVSSGLRDGDRIVIQGASLLAQMR
jgi:RND family efflux transporter MFP subunit